MKEIATNLKKGEDQSHPVAEYVHGEIRVFDTEGRHDRMESELVTSHEQFHHMIRLKSSFGVYVARLFASLSGQDPSPNSFALQALASGFRTSDEVLATYASARMAAWHYGEEPIRGILDRYPTYNAYYSLGQSLVDDGALPLLAATSVEAIIRFCWSPISLIDFNDISLTNLRKQVSPCQFPDKRFEHFIRVWSTRDWHDQADAMMADSPSLYEVLARPYMAMLDPFYDVMAEAKAQNRLFMMGADAQSERAIEIQKNRDDLNRLAAQLAWKGYDYLNQKFKDTSMASVSRGVLLDLMSQQNASHLDVAEALYVRTARRRATLQEPMCFEPWLYHVDVNASNYPVTPVFIRPLSKLQQHLDIAALQHQGHADPNAIAIYSINAGTTINIDPLEIRLKIVEGWGDVAKKLQEIPIRGPLIIWTSDIGSGTIELNSLAPIWLICDTQPLHAVQLIRSYMEEVRGVSCASRVPGSGLKALSIFRVSTTGDIDGIIFPGTATMSDPIVPLVFKVYSDDFRDFNSAGLVFDYDPNIREKVGRLIVDLISITERWFVMSESERAS